MELATAYISILPETSKIAPGVKQALGETEKEGEKTGKSLGGKIAGGLSGVLKGGAVAAGAALAAGIGMGIGRLTAIEDAKAQLEGLGHSADSVNTVMKSALDSVKGTSYGLADAATVAASSVAAGIAPGEDLTRTLKLVADSASIAGTDLGSMGAIFNKVATSGKVQGDVLNQLSDRGIPIVALLGKQLGVTAGEVTKLASDGKIGFADFQGAMEKGLGGAALASGDTVSGSFDNMKAALGRLGAVIAGPLFSVAPTILSGITSSFGAMEGALSPLAAAAGEKLGKVGEGIKGLTDILFKGDFTSAFAEAFNIEEDSPIVDKLFKIREGVIGVFDLVTKGDFTGAFASAFGLEEDSPIVDKLFTIREAIFGFKDSIVGAFNEISGGVRAFIAAFTDGGDDITSSGFAGFLEQLGVYARDLYDIIKVVGPIVLDVISKVGGVLLDLGQAAIPIVVGAFGTLFDILSSIVNAITGTINFFKEHKDVAVALAAVLGPILIPALVAFTASLVAQAASWVAATAAAIAYNAIGTALSVATKVWAAGQWLLNAALSANPIGLIIAALVALVAGIVLAYKNSETFRNIVQAAWEGIQTAVSAVWGFLQGVFASFIQGFKDMGSIAAWLWNNAIKPAWDGIQTAISAAWGFIQGVFESFMQGFRDIGSLVTWFYDTIIAPYFNLVGTVISTVVDGAVGAFGFFMDGLGKVGDFVGNVVDGIASVWDGLRSILAKPINFLINTVWNDGILKAWNAVADFLPGIDPASPLAGIPEHATGGAIGGKGGIDNVLMWGTRNEHMLTVDEVNKAGGHGAVYAIRDMIARGIPFSWDNGQIVRDLGKENLAAYGNAVKHKGLGNVDPAGMFNQLLPGYKDGGAIEPWHEQLANGHRAAQSRNGNPYTWGFEDCSGYMSMIADAIINGGNGVRRWATSSFPGGQPWQPGLGEGFSVGVHDDPGGPGGGHTAGTLSAVGQYSTVNVESGGSHGNVAYGGPAAGADSSQFVGVSPGQYHLAIGANGFFQSGGAGGGTGPSPAEQSSFLTDKIRDVFNGIVSPIRSGIVGAIGAPPPEYLGLPPKFLDTGVDLTSKFLGDSVGNLGELLSSAWQGAKNLVGNLFDSGGVFPNNSIGINTSGKPEAVLTNDQWSLFKEFNDVIATVGPEFMEKMSGIASTAGLEILGLDGTLLDPEANRYLKAGQEIAKTAQEFQAKRASESAEVVQPVVNNDYSVNINNPTFQDQNQALRDAGAMQQRSMMRNAGRP